MPVWDWKHCFNTCMGLITYSSFVLVVLWLFQPLPWWSQDLMIVPAFPLLAKNRAYMYSKYMVECWLECYPEIPTKLKMKSTFTNSHAILIFCTLYVGLMLEVYTYYVCIPDLHQAREHCLLQPTFTYRWYKKSICTNSWSLDEATYLFLNEFLVPLCCL